MKIVYSFWGDAVNPTHWCSSRFMITSFVLSVLQSHKLYGRVEVVTDSINKIWIEKLNLPLEKISTELDEIDHYDRESWSLGKIKAYQIQEEPFMHVDIDVIMYNKFSDDFFNCDIGVQEFELFTNEERLSVYDYYIKTSIKYIEEENLPMGFLDGKRSMNMGVYYCNNIEFNKLYCSEVFRFLDNSLEILKDKLPLNKFCLTWEQYICTCIADLKNLKINEVYHKFDCYKSQSGYVHLLTYKQNKDVANNFNDIIKWLYPEYTETINNVINFLKIKEDS